MELFLLKIILKLWNLYLPNDTFAYVIFIKLHGVHENCKLLKKGILKIHNYAPFLSFQNVSVFDREPQSHPCRL